MERFDSWKEIAAYLRHDIRTVQRWHVNSGLPIHHVPGSRRGSVFAYRAELDSWLNCAAPPAAVSAVGAGDRSALSGAADLWECHCDENIFRIIALCQKTIIEDPCDADTYGMMASAYIWAAYADLLPASFAFVRAERAIRKALEINSSQNHALCAEAWLILCNSEDRERAEAQFRKCAAALPYQASSLIGLATICVVKGNLDEARDVVMRAATAKPLSPSISYAINRLYYHMKEFGRVIAEGTIAVKIGHNSANLQGIIGLSYVALGREEEAVDILREAENRYPACMLVKGALGYAFAISGYPLEAEAYLNRVVAERSQAKGVSAYSAALICAGLKEWERVLHWLAQDKEDLTIWSLTMELDNAFSFLRHDNRFLALARMQHHCCPVEVAS